MYWLSVFAFCFFPLYYGFQSPRKFLTVGQKTQIDKLLQQSLLTKAQHDTLNRVLFSYYSSWARNRAYDFKRHHRFICKNVKVDDLVFAALTGLRKGTRNYNGLGSFTHYVDYYISGELYRCCKQMKFVDMPNPSIQSTPIHSHDYTEYWTHLLNSEVLTPTEKRILCYKLSSNFEKERSNQYVAELMCCSEETVRKHIHSIAGKINKE